MRILLTSATKFEMLPAFINNNEATNSNEFISKYKTHEIVSFITGIGMLPTVYFTSKILSIQKFDLALNIGIAGLYFGNANIGDVFFIKKDFIPELGSGNDEIFVSAFDKKLIDNNEKPYQEGFLKCNYNFDIFKNQYFLANGITVNRTQMFNRKLLPDSLFDLPILETMENAAFYYSCISNDLPFIGIRAVSNFTSDIDKTKWNINLAVKNLHKKTLSLLNEF